MKYLFLACLFLIPLAAEARPVSYPEGWTVMLKNDGDRHSLHTHYSPTFKYSVGVRNEYDRVGDYQMHSMQLNNLVKRWNNPDSQANFYIKSGVGYAIEDGGGDESPVGYTGIALDWEDRRYFTSYENRYIHAGDIDRKFMQSARIGIAPYIGDFGDLHTWLMVQADHKPTAEDGDHFTVTPLIRLFYDTHLMETGISDNNDILFNYIKRF
jgi:hypothetical protein